MSSDKKSTPTRAQRSAPRTIGFIALTLFFLGVIGVIAGVALTAGPDFLGSYEGYAENHETLQGSMHADLDCEDCHVDSRGAVVASAARVGDFYGGLAGKPDTPQFTNVDTPTRDACLACHGEDWSQDASRTARIPHPAHLRTENEERECVECHKWTGHEEEYIERHKEMPFSAVCASFPCHVGTKAQDQCADCHHAVQVTEVEDEWLLNHKAAVKRVGSTSCLESCHVADECRQCHTTGERPEFDTEGLSQGVDEIEREHVKADWMEQHGKWAAQDENKCFDCHVSPAECADCHSKRPDFHGLEETWLNRHQEFEEGDSRCLTCHEQEYCDECHEQFEETG
jgi:hypothetical protein